MEREAVFVVVGRIVIVALVALAVRDVALRARVHRLERAVAAVQTWAEPQLRAVRSERAVTPARRPSAPSDIVNLWGGWAVANLLLHVDSAEDTELTVARFALRERLSEPFSLSVVAGSTHPDLDLEDLILRPASFAIDAGRSHGRRSYTGICFAAEQISAEPAGVSLYRIRIVPRLGLLGLRRDHRIYQQLTIPAILAQMLA